MIKKFENLLSNNENVTLMSQNPRQLAIDIENALNTYFPCANKV